MKAGRFWEASLIVEAIHGFHSSLVASALLPGGDDGVPHAAVGEPAWATAVQALAPGQVQLARCGQHRPRSLAVELRLVE